MLNHPRLLHMAAALLLLTATSPALRAQGEPDIVQYRVVKGQHFRQAASGTPALLPAGEHPHVLNTGLQGREPGSILDATLRFPNLQVIHLHGNEDGQWEYEAGFATKQELDSAAGQGTYTFTVTTANEGVRTLTRTLGADAYPASAPRFLNYTNFHGANPSNAITIRWQPLSGGTVQDYVRLAVEEEYGTAFNSGEPGAPNSLNGTSTSITIPAGTLTTNASYRVYLLHAKLTSMDASRPGTVGMTAFYKETELAWRTWGPPPDDGRFEFSSAAYEVQESSGGASITLRRLGGATATTGSEVTVTTRPGTALPGIDYVESTNTYSFDPGQDSIEVFIEVLDNLNLDGDRTVVLSLSDPSPGSEIGFVNEAVLTITDDEDPSRGVLQFASSQVTVDEGAGRVLLTVNRSGGTQGEVTVNYETEDGSATDPGDFIHYQGLLHFPAGAASRTVEIPIVNDALREGEETFTVRLSEPAGGAALGAARVATVTIRDNDIAGRLSFSAAAYSATEGAGEVLLTIRRTGGAAADVSVDFATGDISAQSPEDYGGRSFTLLLASNETSVTIAIPIEPDQLPEGNETFRATLRNASPGASLGPVTNAVVTILDDEVSVQFAQAAVTQREGSPAALLTLERSGPLNVPASVDLATMPGGSATPGLDFIPTNLTVQIPAGTRKRTIALRLLNDQLVEDAETVLVGLSNPGANTLLGSRSNAIVTITDNDTGGTLQFALSAFNAPEARPSALLIITRTLGLASNVTCRLATRALTATDGLDFIGTNTVLEWRANETRKLVRIPLLPDALVEGNEQFEATLSDATGGAALGPRTTLTVTLQDDDKGGVIGFARPVFTAAENATNAAVVLQRTGGSAGGVTVRFLALEGTASSPADFTEQNVVVEFAPGQTSRTLLLPLNNDTNAEPTETIQLVLQEATGGATLAAATNATLRLTDDESSVAFSADSGAGTEGSLVFLTVVRSGPVTTSASIDYRTVDGTATAGSDYAATSGTLVFRPGQASRTLPVRLAADGTAEPDETFTVELLNPQGGLQLRSPETVTITIRNR